MTIRARILFAVLWGLSLVLASQWKTEAQIAPPPGVEVRFVQGKSTDGTTTGALVANIHGQWLPVKLAVMPDANDIRR